MQKKQLLFLMNICIIMSCVFVFTGCDKTQTENEPPFVYTATTLMYDENQILNFYSNDLNIAKVEDNTTISPVDCFYDTSNKICSQLITKCYELWAYCENGGISYIDTYGSITENYTIEYDGKNCNVVYVYTDTSRSPTSSAFRITKKYKISFNAEHLSICYENENESFYNETKHYVDILSINDGIFMQYYKKEKSLNTYIYDIYKFFYKETSKQFYYVSNLIKEGSKTKYLQNIQLTQFEDFILPDFTYIIKK